MVPEAETMASSERRVTASTVTFGPVGPPKARLKYRTLAPITKIAKMSSALRSPDTDLTSHLRHHKVANGCCDGVKIPNVAAW